MPRPIGPANGRDTEETQRKWPVPEQGEALFGEQGAGPVSRPLPYWQVARVPHRMAVGAFALPPLLRVAFRSRRTLSLRRRRRLGLCRRCGYDLTGNTSGRCSGCGEAVSPPVLSDAQRLILESIVRKTHCPQAIALRARLVLAAAAGLGPSDAAREMGCSRKVARLWPQRFARARREWGEAAERVGPGGLDREGAGRAGGPRAARGPLHLHARAVVPDHGGGRREAARSAGGPSPTGRRGNWPTRR